MTPAPDPAERVAVLLPGRAYTVDQPVLFYAAEAVRELGWRTEAVTWDPEGMTEEAVVARGCAVIDSLAGASVLVIGKSLGSLLLPCTVERALPAVWLTPLLTHAGVRAATRRMSAPALLVGGTHDPVWDAQVAHASGRTVLELPGGDHGLQVAGDVSGSVRFLGELVEAVRAFVRGLDPG